MTLRSLCFSSLGCPQLSLPQIFELARSNTIPSIELRCIAGSVLAPDNLSELLPAPVEIRDQQNASGVRIASLGTSVKLLEAKQADLDTLMSWGRFADQIGCPFLRVFDGGDASAVITAAELQRTAEWFANWESLRHQHGIAAQISVETHDGLVRADSMCELRDTLPDLPILWDLHHTWRAGTDSEVFADIVGDALVHVHLKDSISRPSARKPFTYVAPGEGEFDWAGALDLLDRIGFTGTYSFEWERHWHPDLAPLPEVLGAFCTQLRNR